MKLSSFVSEIEVWYHITIHLSPGIRIAYGDGHGRVT
jgi:hypothetical protein